MRSNRFTKSLSVFLSLLMLLTTLAVGVVPLKATAVVNENYGIIASDTLLGKYFSNDRVWYDAATGHNQLSWQVNGYPEFRADQNNMTYLNNLYLKINTYNLFAGVNADTGLTFSYTYRPEIGDWHRHILSLGASEYSGSGSNQNNHFYISATNSWLNRDAGNIWTVPVVGYVDGSGVEHIRAMPASDAPLFEIGQTYDIVVTVSKTTGITYNINGNDYETIYFESNKNEQLQYIEALLNSVAGYHYNYIGVSRWGDGYFTGYIKDLSIYGKAYTKAQLDVDSVVYSAAFINEAKTNFDVNKLSLSESVFAVQPKHVNDPIDSDSYSNYVYAGGTSWSGDGVGDVFWGVGRTDFKFAVPGNNVLVYDGTHDVIAPVTLESYCNDTGGSSHIIKYVAQTSDLLSLQQNWQGYSLTWDKWAKNNIDTAESFSHKKDTAPESPDTQRTTDHRFWWNTLKYNGSGNTTTYFDADYNIQYDANTAYKSSGASSHTDKYGTITSLANYFIINYQPIYSILSEAAAFYNNNIAGQEWKYTDDSLNQAMVALYLIQKSNPINYDYASDSFSAVRLCASVIKQAIAEYAKINLVKKTATVHITQGAGTVLNVSNNGTALIDGATVTYGDTLSATADAMPTYDQNDPVITINGGTVNGSSTLVNEPNIYISTADLPLNRYSLTLNEGEGTAIAYTVSEAADANGKYPYGAVVTASASAVTGYDQGAASLFVTGGSTQSVVDGVYTISMTSDVTLTTAALAKNKYQITVNAGTGTTITGVSTGEYEYDTELTVTAAADTGYTQSTLTLSITGETVTGLSHTFRVTGPVTVSTNDLDLNTYTVTFNYGDGQTSTVTKTHGTTLTTAEIPTDTAKEQTVSTVYTFTGWSGDTAAPITGDTLFTAQYSETPREYVVIFNNYDNTKLYETTVAYGSTAVYTGDTPVKPMDVYEHTFTFVGWDRPLENVTGNTVFTAVFNTNHEYSAVYTGDETEHWKVCVKCGEIDESSRTAHVFSITVTDRVATCSLKGMEHTVCSICQYATESVFTDYNPENHADYGTYPLAAVPATCCTVGYTEGTACVGCNAVRSGHEEVAVDTTNGHLYPETWTSNGNSTHSRTCTREGCTVETANHTQTENCTTEGEGGSVATCASPAVCAVCHEPFGNTNPAIHSNLQEFDYNAPTCEQPGNEAFSYCSGCNKYFMGGVEVELEDVLIEPLGHEWSVTWNWNTDVTPPTATAYFVCAHGHNTVVNATVSEFSSTAAHCGESGNVTYRASYTMDGVTYTTEGGNDKTVVTASLPHVWRVSGCVWSEDHSTVTMYIVCDRGCGTSDQITDVPAHPVEVSAADCENDQIVKYTATVSDYEDDLHDIYSFTVETDPITNVGSALGHKYEFVDWDWAEDYASATANFRCTREGCDHTTSVTDLERETIPVRAADCEYDAVVKYKAKVTLLLEKDDAEPTAFTDTTDEITLEGTKTNEHAWGEISYDWNEDHTAVTATRVCGNYASHVETETVSAEYVVVTPAKCAEDGSAEYRSAAFTNPAFSAQTYPVTLTHLGHDFSVEAAEEEYLASAATCLASAVYYKTCSRCGLASETDTFPSGDPLGHDFDDTIAANVEIEDPSCTEAGLKTVKCSRCSVTEETVIQPLGHDYGEWTETLAPYCTTTGTERRDCSRCDAFETRTVPALGHDWGEWIVVTPPDYGVSGLDKRVCARCGAEDTRVTVLTSDADKFVKFNTISKMKYVLSVGDGFVFDHTSTFVWYSAKELTFTVSILPGADYSSVDVYLNGSKLAPNADGSYTIPAHVGDDVVMVAPEGETPAGIGTGTGTGTGTGAGSSGVCPYCGQTHANNLWGRIVALFHTILAFFRNIFRR